jgi:hypothetical protein
MLWHVRPVSLFGIFLSVLFSFILLSHFLFLFLHGYFVHCFVFKNWSMFYSSRVCLVIGGFCRMGFSCWAIFLQNGFLPLWVLVLQLVSWSFYPKDLSKIAYLETFYNFMSINLHGFLCRLMQGILLCLHSGAGATPWRTSWQSSERRCHPLIIGNFISHLKEAHFKLSSMCCRT